MVEKADSSSVLPCPVSISTKNKMNFLFANLKDRDFLVQRISDFLQRTPDSSDAAPPSPSAASVCPSGSRASMRLPGLLPSLTCPLAPQVSTILPPRAGSQPPQRRQHFHPELPTASQSLLQLYQQHLQEDLGPKAVGASMGLGGVGGGLPLQQDHQKGLLVPHRG